MKNVYIIIGSLHILIFALYFFFAPVANYINCVYTSNSLQVPIFSGLLTVGAFLLSMKTFIVFKLKDDLYDNPKYIEKVYNSSVTDDYDHYKGLKELSDFLSLSVLASIISAVFNITIGYIETNLSSSISLTFATCAIGLLLYSWWLVWFNLRSWLEILKNPQPNG